MEETPRGRRIVIKPEWARRRRRPSGEPEPLPRRPLAGASKFWILLAALVVLVVALLLSSTSFFLGSGSWWNSLDEDVMGVFIDARAGWLTNIAEFLDQLRSDWLITTLRLGTIVTLVFVKRWRHLMIFVTVMLTTEPLMTGLANRLARPRPDGIQFLTDWAGFSFPSIPLTALTVTLLSMAYALVVPGLLRKRVLVGISGVLTLVGLSRIYLGVERPTEMAVAGIIGATISMLAFRLITPDSVFPVSYDRSKSAHLELNEARLGAIFSGLRDQLGFEAVSAELFGAEGSAGSTPLRIGLADGGYIFAKLYAQNHLRSDRWYKLGRTLLYGALEDETSYRSVRRLAEHEDHVMRLMAAGGIPIPEPLGIVEITHGREYLLVTEFLDAAGEMSQSVVSEPVVDAGLQAVRAMWDSGLAHRDIKPANILVRNDDIYLIDHAFGEIRPSPWRQAVDLANMMLTLSVGYPPEEVHSRAALIFSDDEIGEAFAVARSVTIPGELRTAIKSGPDDLLARNRQLAAPRQPIGIQRWTPRRISALVAVIGGAAVIARLIALNLSIVGRLL